MYYINLYKVQLQVNCTYNARKPHPNQYKCSELITFINQTFKNKNYRSCCSWLYNKVIFLESLFSKCHQNITMFRWLALRSPNTQFSGVGGIGTQNKTVFRWLALRSSNTPFSGGKGGNGTQNITVFLWLALRFPNTQFSGGGWNGKITIWGIDRDRAREWAVYMTLENIYTIGWDDIKTKAGSYICANVHKKSITNPFLYHVAIFPVLKNCHTKVMYFSQWVNRLFVLRYSI